MTSRDKVKGLIVELKENLNLVEARWIALLKRGEKSKPFIEKLIILNHTQGVKIHKLPKYDSTKRYLVDYIMEFKNKLQPHKWYVSDYMYCQLFPTTIQKTLTWFIKLMTSTIMSYDEFINYLLIGSFNEPNLKGVFR